MLVVVRSYLSNIVVNLSTNKNNNNNKSNNKISSITAAGKDKQ